MSAESQNELQVVYLGLGSNIGNKLLNIKNAIEELNNLPETKVIARSSFYRSEPWGFKNQDWFVNAVVAVLTQLSPEQLLKESKRLEKEMGCKPKKHRWGPRLIDIDILLYGGEIVDTPELKIPHPYLTERLFFLAPLLQIAPAATLPPHSQPLQSFADKLKNSQLLVVLEE